MSDPSAGHKESGPPPSSVLSELKPGKDPDTTCKLCLRPAQEEGGLKLGPLYSYENGIYRAHLYCLFFSSGLYQNGEDEEGIKGFLTDDIAEEWRRGSSLKCTYCKKEYATVICRGRCKGRGRWCRKRYHLPCGMENGSLQQFYGQFFSFCQTHRPIQAPFASAKKMGVVGRNLSQECCICRADLEVNPNSVLWTPCCDGGFHRDCLEKMAASAGLHHFKCPLCNNIEEFSKEMLKFGIYLPDQDAAWETEGAFDDQLARQYNCDAPVCVCPEGPKLNVENTVWEIKFCLFCGHQGIHIECAKLDIDPPPWKCSVCKEFVKASPVSEFTSVERGVKEVPVSDNPLPVQVHKKKVERKEDTIRNIPCSWEQCQVFLSGMEIQAHLQRHREEEDADSEDKGTTEAREDETTYKDERSASPELGNESVNVEKELDLSQASLEIKKVQMAESPGKADAADSPQKTDLGSLVDVEELLDSPEGSLLDDFGVEPLIELVKSPEMVGNKGPIKPPFKVRDADGKELEEEDCVIEEKTKHSHSPLKSSPGIENNENRNMTDCPDSENIKNSDLNLVLLDDNVLEKSQYAFSDLSSSKQQTAPTKHRLEIGTSRLDDKEKSRIVDENCGDEDLGKFQIDDSGNIWCALTLNTLLEPSLHNDEDINSSYPPPCSSNYNLTRSKVYEVPVTIDSSEFGLSEINYSTPVYETNEEIEIESIKEASNIIVPNPNIAANSRRTNPPGPPVKRWRTEHDPPSLARNEDGVSQMIQPVNVLPTQSSPGLLSSSAQTVTRSLRDSAGKESRKPTSGSRLADTMGTRLLPKTLPQPELGMVDVVDPGIGQQEKENVDLETEEGEKEVIDLSEEEEVEVKIEVMDLSEEPEQADGEKIKVEMSVTKYSALKELGFL